MLENLFYILNTVREKILEGFIIPGLNMSYWEFLCMLAIVGIVITVLVNSVQVGAGRGARSEDINEKERARVSVRKSSNSSGLSHSSSELDLYEKFMEGK